MYSVVVMQLLLTRDLAWREMIRPQAARWPQAVDYCDGSALAHYSSFRFQIPIPLYHALRAKRTI